MLFTALNIENFGPFENRSFKNLSPRLTVILGPNEAGKSAMRAFIRMVLFGFGDKRQRDHFDFYNYPPVRGGSASGSISVKTALGKDYTVLRREGPHGGPVTVTGDESGGNDLVALLIGHISEDVYQNVFSISLRELQQFETLNSGQVHDRIYSAGLGLGTVSLPDILQGFDQELRRLWAPRSGNMRDGFKDKSTKMTALQSARNQLGAYRDLEKQEQDLAGKIEETKTILRNLRADEERQKRLFELVEPWGRQRVLRDQIDPLPDPRTFPTDGTDRFSDLEKTRNDHANKIMDEDRKEGARRRDIEGLNVVDAFTRHEADIERLLTEIAHYLSASKDLPELQGKLTEIESLMGSSLQALGPLWSEAKLSEPFDANSIDELLQAIDKRLDKERDRFRSTQHSLDVANRAEAEALEAAEKARRERDALQDVPNESVDALRARQDRLQRLQAAVVDLASKEQALLAIDLQLAAISWGGRRAGMPKPLWIAAPLVIVGLLVSLVGVTSEETTGIVAGALMALGGLGIFFWFRSLKKEGSGLSDGTSSLDTLNRDREQLSGQSDEIQREIKALLSDMELDEPSSERVLVERLAAIGRSIQRREEYDRLISAVEEAESGLEQALGSSRTGSADVDTAKTAVDDVATELRALLVDVHLGPDLESSAALVRLGLIRELRGQAQAAGSLRERIKDITNSLSDIEKRLRPVLDEAGMLAFQPGQALSALEELRVRFRRHLEGVEKRQSLEKQCRDWEPERAGLQISLEEAARQSAELLSAAGCADKEAFLEMGQQVEKRRVLELELDELYRSRPLLVNEDGLSLRDELTSITAEEAPARLREISEGILRAEQEREEHLGDLRSLRDQRRHLEDSNPAQDLQFDIAELTERVKQEAHRWAVLTISRNLLEQAGDDFQRERQGPLLQAASGYFTRFTRGQYARVETVIGEEKMRIVDSSERTKDAHVALSRGTAEQLYLAMRFALIDEYSSNSERMPVLLDDVMVNFDPERARAACDGIVDVSARHQVLVLTCHPNTVEQLQAASADVEAPQPLVIEI